jgi:hypothetical protein
VHFPALLERPLVSACNIGTGAARTTAAARKASRRRALAEDSN